mgnify:FL=1
MCACSASRLSSQGFGFFVLLFSLAASSSLSRDSVSLSTLKGLSRRCSLASRTRSERYPKESARREGKEHAPSFVAAATATLFLSRRTREKKRKKAESRLRPSLPCDAYAPSPKLCPPTPHPLLAALESRRYIPERHWRDEAFFTQEERPSITFSLGRRSSCFLSSVSLPPSSLPTSSLFLSSRCGHLSRRPTSKAGTPRGDDTASAAPPPSHTSRSLHDHTLKKRKTQKKGGPPTTSSALSSPATATTGTSSSCTRSATAMRAPSPSPCG